MPRQQNAKADFLSKIIDCDDYSVHDELFAQLDEFWGLQTVDRLAHCYNAKLPRFNSRFLQPCTEAYDAFTQDWSSENNWLVPPITFVSVGNVLADMKSCSAHGTLVVPMRKSEYFWPLLCTDGVHLNSFIADWMYLPSRPDKFVKGEQKTACFPHTSFSQGVLLFKLILLLQMTAVHMRAFALLQRGTALCVSPRSSVFRYVPNPAFTFLPSCFVQIYYFVDAAEAFVY